MKKNLLECVEFKYKDGSTLWNTEILLKNILSIWKKLFSLYNLLKTVLQANDIFENFFIKWPSNQFKPSRVLPSDIHPPNHPPTQPSPLPTHPPPTQHTPQNHSTNAFVANCLERNRRK